MIRIEYNRNENSTKVSVGDISPLNPIESLRVSFKNIITGTVHYEAELNSNMWVVWNGAELITDVVISDTEGNLITEWKWEVLRDGDDIEKALWLYLKSQEGSENKPNGLVIGSHDGTNGHWIYPVKEGLTNATLIDGGKKQYDCLVENYRKIAGLTFINEIVNFFPKFLV